MKPMHLASIILGLAVAPAVAETVATVGDKTITRAELEAEVKPRLIELENERYEALKDGLDEMVHQALFEMEAKARGVTSEQLMQQEIESKVAESTDADIQKVYDENKARLQGKTLDEVKPQIVNYLKQQKMAERANVVIGELKKKYKTTIALRPPVVEVSTGTRPARGGKNAKVTIVEFSDYECPFCKKAEAAVDQVMTTYGDKVRLYYRDYPLPFHPNAKPAAEAAHCANAQGKFWEYHGKVMKSDDLKSEKLKSMAAEVGLDATKFDECLSKSTFSEAVEQDMADGAAVGVNGTPAFFINGRMLSGAQPFEAFKEIIDEELAMQK